LGVSILSPGIVKNLGCGLSLLSVRNTKLTKRGTTKDSSVDRPGALHGLKACTRQKKKTHKRNKNGRYEHILMFSAREVIWQRGMGVVKE